MPVEANSNTSFKIGASKWCGVIAQNPVRKLAPVQKHNIN